MNLNDVETIEKILDNIDYLTNPSDMPKRIKLCRHGISINRNSKLEYRLLVELGKSLCQNIQGNRLLEIEEAIKVYNQALMSISRETMAYEWAEVIMYLGIAYYDRIQGLRADNIEKAIELYHKSLEVRTKDLMPSEWATVMVNLGNAYLDRIQGEKSENIEKTINAYNKALEINTKETMPFEWAELMMNIGNAYSDRIKGDRENNFEMAISAYQKSLEVYTKSLMPYNWATVMLNLGNAYSDRIKGNRSENIEKAIKAYQKVLEINTKNEMPLEWAQVMNNLGSAYRNRIIGNRAENIEKAINAYKQSLLVRNKTETPIEWANVMMNLGIAYRNRIKGDRAENIEKAIGANKKALEINTKDTMPYDWTRIMNNLGNVYLDRIHGKRASNIEVALNSFQQALEINIKTVMPFEWAKYQMNLGNAYLERIRGNRSENIEKGITAYKKGIEVSTKNFKPYEWSTAMMNLGTAYLDRIQGERAENIEIAINSYNQALKIIKKNEIPFEWATLNFNLGTAYLYRVKGERAENIEEGLTLYQQTLDIISKDSLPVEWAKIMLNMGNTYFFRIKGNRSYNIEKAINAYKQALDINTEDKMPLDWSDIMMSLGNAYLYRIKGKRAENIEKAISSYKDALKLNTKDEMPIDWARIMMNLGIAYSYRMHGKREENIETTIKVYQQALRVNTKDSMPFEWGQLMMNLGNAYSFRIQGKRTENIKKAINAYEKSLKIFTFDQFPLIYFIVNYNYCLLLFEEQNWNVAFNQYMKTIDAGNYLLNIANTEYARKHDISETSQLYFDAAYCMLKLNNYCKAFHYLEQGKTRFLKQELIVNELNMKYLTQNQKNTIKKEKQNIQNLENEINQPYNTPGKRNIRVITEKLRKSREIIQSTFTETGKQNPNVMHQELELSEILHLIPKGGAIVAPLITSQGSYIFVVPHNVISINNNHLIIINDFNKNSLKNLLIGKKNKPGWLIAYNQFKKNSEEIIQNQAQLSDNEKLYLLQEEHQKLKNTIDLVNQKLWDIFMKPVYNKLNEYGCTNDSQILLMPQGGLGLLPLHTACREINHQKCYFIDDYCVTYIPSAYIYNIANKRIQDKSNNELTLLSVINPTDDLNFANDEGEVIASLFNQSIELYKNDADVDKVVINSSKNRYLHFACHGFYNWKQPMKSGLQLAHKKQLTLSTIISKMNLEKSRLVVLSACETGITDIKDAPDEYIGLPTGFMQAGAPGVVSTLWGVNDMSTMLLIERFYLNHIQKEILPTKALRNAQLWLRNVTTGELLRKYFNELQKYNINNRMSQACIINSITEYSKMNPNEKPFAHPYYWAGFIFNGA